VVRCARLFEVHRREGMREEVLELDDDRRVVVARRDDVRVQAKLQVC